MTLIDILKDRTRGILDSIKNLNASLEKLQAERRLTINRISHARSAIEAKVAVVSEREKTVKVAQAKVEELDRQLQEIRDRLKERMLDLERLRQERVEASEAVSEERNGERGELHRAESLQQEIFRLEEQIAYESGRLREARSDALTVYLSYLWKRLVEHSSHSEQRLKAVEVKSIFESQRHSDIGVANLWEAREGWKNIAASRSPTLVLQTAKAEISRIEGELEAKFPGILEALAGGGPVSEAEVLFYREIASEGLMAIALPIPMDAWNAIENGKIGPEESLAMNLVWMLARSESLVDADAKFEIDNGQVVFVTKKSSKDLDEVGFTSIQLSGGNSVSFILSPVPNEVAEVMTL